MTPEGIFFAECEAGCGKSRKLLRDKMALQISHGEILYFSSIWGFLWSDGRHRTPQPGDSSPVKRARNDTCIFLQSVKPVRIPSKKEGAAEAGPYIPSKKEGAAKAAPTNLYLVGAGVVLG